MTAYSNQKEWFKLQNSFLSEKAKEIKQKSFDDISDEEFDLLDKEIKIAEKKAKKELVRRLQQFITLIESPGYPDVFGCNMPVNDPPCSNGGIMDSISITLSHVWPG